MSELTTDLIDVLGLAPGEAEKREAELETAGLVILTNQGDFRFAFQPTRWTSALEKLRGGPGGHGRFTGDNRHDAWRDHPSLIDALLPGAVTSLLSRHTDDGIALVTAIAAQVAGGLVANRLHAVLVVHGPLMTRVHLIHRQPGGLL